MNALGKQMLKMGSRASWRNVATVDPGLGGTGAALWQTLALATARPTPPTNTFAVSARRGDWHDRMRKIVDVLMARLLTSGWRTNILVLEMPRLWTSSAKSQGAAADGTLFKLSALTGAIIYVARQYNIPVAEVYPDEWKGQLDDRLVHKRIAEKLGLRYPTHVHDAVGIGLAIQGVLCSDPR